MLVHAVRDLLTQLTSYVTELTDYALDALDGAAVSFASVHREVVVRRSNIRNLDTS